MRVTMEQQVLAEVRANPFQSAREIGEKLGIERVPAQMALAKLKSKELVKGVKLKIPRGKTQTGWEACNKNNDLKWFHQKWLWRTAA